MSEKKFRITTRLPNTLEFDGEGIADVELFREGEWKHPAAPDGWFKVTKERIKTFINNFNRGICGYELPLEFNHAQDSEKTPGWVVGMYETVKDGISHLYGKLKLTDPVTRDRIKNGSLKFISPTVVSDYVDTASGQMFEVIRSATLTNYPHIKGLEPIAVNFEEIQNEEESMQKTEKEILENNELQLEDLDTITLDQLKKGDIVLEYLTKEQIVELAEKFEMTVEQFQEQYPVAGTKMYGNRPKLKLPANVPPEQKKAFLDAFNAAYDKYQDVDKAMKVALRSIGVQMEAETPTGVKEFVEMLGNYIKKVTGRAPIKISEEDVDATKFEELQKEVKALKAYRERVELQEDASLVESFKLLTPAAKKIVQALLVAGRNTSLKFEETTISLHDMLISLFEELKNNPTMNMFAELSHKETLDLSEDLSVAIDKYRKDHPEVEYRAAYDICFQEFKRAGKVK